MSRLLFERWGYVFFWLLLSLTVLFHAPLPIDETRYLSVAWEMWQRGDFLVPYLNGHTYSHKPPLLFWLMHASWWLFGMNDITPRLVGPVCSLLNLLLVRLLARRLWPDRPEIANLAPWILLSTLLWALFASSTMFDTLQTNCVLLAMLGLLTVAEGRSIQGWLLVGLGLGLGILAKGPVILIHVLPTALAVAYWRREYFSKVWFIGLGLAIGLGGLLALLWALPAAEQGGAEYGNAILWHQTADRTVGTKIHARGPHWYLMFLPLLLLPWLAWPKLWQKIRANSCWQESSTRFCLTWFGATLIALSLVPSKQVHYLIPILPALALLIGRVLSPSTPANALAGELLVPLVIALLGMVLIALPYTPAKWYWVQNMQFGWGAAVLVLALLLMFHTVKARQLSVIATSITVTLGVCLGLILFFRYSAPAYDLTLAAQKIRAFQTQNKPYTFVGDYQGQFQFLGKLNHPVPVIDSQLLPQWLIDHPNGIWISLDKAPAAKAWYQQLHREHWLIFRTVND